MKTKVTDYTTDVLAAMKSNGTPPDIVEIGNETTDGMLWPDGKLDGDTPDQKQKKWANYAALLKAGIRGVRSQLPAARILVHIDSGGRAAPPCFFDELKEYNPDFDIIGLSFYPTWKDSIDVLKQNLSQLSSLGKDILIIETAYPYKPVNPTPQTQWPMTPAGQKQFLDQLIFTVQSAPGSSRYRCRLVVPRSAPNGESPHLGKRVAWIVRSGRKPAAGHVEPCAQVAELDAAPICSRISLVSGSALAAGTIFDPNLLA